MLKMLDLFSGIGGISLGAEATGCIETVGFCEIEPYPVKILEKRWPDVPVYKDVRMLTKTRLRNDGLLPLDIVAGGFPCQDVSTCGKRAGFLDSQGKVTRSGLWGEMCRLISEIRPRWVVAENVWGLLSIPSSDGLKGGGFGIVLGDLAELGYSVGWGCYGASDVGAIHRRRRVFIVAYSPGKRWGSMEKNKHKGFPLLSLGISKKRASDKGLIPFNFMGVFNKPKRGVLRNDDGISRGMDRLKCLGNAVVPQQIYPIFQAIAEIEGQEVK